MKLATSEVALSIGPLMLAVDQDGRLMGVSFGGRLERMTCLLRHERALLI